MLKEENKRVKIKFSKKIENLPFKTRLEVTEAVRSRSEQKKINTNKFNYVYFDQKEVQKLVKEFDNDYKLNVDQHKEIKTENDIFINKYENAKKKTALKKDNSSENIFSELMMKYKERGYHNVRDIKMKTNLFEVSPLLLTNNKIFDFYKLGDNFKLYSKDLEYTKKIKKMLNDRFLSEGRKKSMIRDKLKLDLLNSESNLPNEKTMKELVKEMHSNKEAIKQASNILAHKELKSIFNDFNHSPSQMEKISETFNKTSQEIGKPNIKFLVTSKSINNSKKAKKIVHNISHVLNKKPKMVNNFSIIDSEGIDMDGENQTPIKKQNQSKLSNSVFSLMKENSKSKSGKLKNRKRLNFSEGASSPLIDEEKKRFKEKIEAKINLRKVPELEKLQEKIHNKESVNKDIIDYLVEKVGRDRYNIEEGLKKKIGPNDVMKYIADLKSKVLSVDFNENYKNFSSKLGILDINLNSLNKISELDKKIYRLDYQLVKDLNQMSKK